ncbi:MAG: LPP20 family lipoprotein [Bacteroidetes bacterium]|nr:LPP20 family lipoprotein [Bacteroidota bacterium]
MTAIVRITCISYFFLAVSLSYGQTMDEIMNSRDYLWGKGVSQSYEKAGKQAIDNLFSKISVEVTSSFTNYVREENDSIYELTESVLKTYSTGHLEGLESLETINERSGETTVLRYIKKTDLTKIFVNRKQKILSFVDCGYKADTNLKIGDALRYYYWALVLLRTHPEFNSMTYAFEGEPEMLLSTLLYERLNSLLGNIDISIHNTLKEPEKDMITYTVFLKYKGKPIGNLDYWYYSGSNYTGPIGAKDGFGAIELSGNYADNADRIRFLVEYKYENECKYDTELRNVMQNTPPPPDFKKSAHWISLPEKDDIPRMQAKKMNMKYHAPQEKKIQTRDYKKIIENIHDAIEKKDTQSIREHFTEDGYDMYNKLITNGNVKVLPLQDTITVVEVNNEIIVRSLPMMFSYHNNTKKFLEDVVFTFNQEQKIDAVSFALGKKAISDIMNKPEPWGTLEERYLLIQFMEYYKTAYALKRLDYIESIFADNALIIVGHVFKNDNTPLDAMYMKLGNEKVKYIYHTKESYIKALRNVFNSNEFVNIQFEDNEVSRTNRLEDKLYGIQIAQNYYSSTYADKGYLFLLIDLNDSMNPKIYVRSWQPEKNPDGSVIGLTDFHF